MIGHLTKIGNDGIRDGNWRTVHDKPQYDKPIMQKVEKRCSLVSIDWIWINQTWIKIGPNRAGFLAITTQRFSYTGS
jgi:hypothetical protein